MKTYPMPAQFDGAKFALRYGLHPGPTDPDFWSAGGFLHVPEDLPDDPPIFEAPNPPQPQGELVWESSEVPGSVRLVAKFNGKKSAIVGLVGADASQTAMYQSPGPIGPQPAGPRREFHVATLADIANIPVSVVDGDTLYVEADGEYRFIENEWKRILTGPSLGSPGDVVEIWAGLEAALDDALGGGGPPLNPKVVAVFTELRKVL
jgi:hypothetical protein